ncbi:hypothetical protein BDF20DRAFT_871364 [Mycotypha africana]|uniref:uncharacterized protein n=1 Tax=Mycotypha africana TaxID=64632 RepID=UPI002300982D|nr:uncharacterized protein BDF20DRAFT_871364 [Mycotypha africana]KAI8979739.1 hypothetical protein BDF20DRAFT_871364 [Mycotypha africana]
MKWRVLIFLATGLAMIYFVSLLQDEPYPHPLVIQAFIPIQSRLNEPSEVILSSITAQNRNIDNYIYRTLIHYEAVLDSNRGFVHGVESFKLNVNGLVIQARKKKNEFIKAVPEEDWEICFKHILSGPITKVVKAPEDSPTVQFAVLYHTVENDTIRHYIRVYYILPSTSVSNPIANNSDDTTKTYHYKDILLPGNTDINAISLEQDSILFSREPDMYKFRVIPLPADIITSPPHSERANVIPLTSIITEKKGDVVREYHQPRGTRSHVNVLCKLYSSNPDTYRVFTLDIHKTKHFYHTNVSIVDSTSSINKDSHTDHIGWIPRDHLYSKDGTVIHEQLQYMAFVDGAHFQQEHRIIQMPNPSVSRSRDSKTIVVSLLRNDFQTLDFTDNVEYIKTDPQESRYLYKDITIHQHQQELPDNEFNILNEFYHTMQVADTTNMHDDNTDIKGLQLNDEGTILAVWTETNSVYIYKRGEGEESTIRRDPMNKRQISKNRIENNLHHRDVPLEWNLRMVILPTEGHLGSITPIGAAIFWNHEGSNYISIGMKNHIVNTYLIDETEERPRHVTSFRNFIKEKWDLWTVMLMVIMIFAINEYKTYQQ